MSTASANVACFSGDDRDVEMCESVMLDFREVPADERGDVVEPKAFASQFLLPILSSEPLLLCSEGAGRGSECMESI